MQYTVIQCRPKDAQKKLNALAANGWKVASQSESTWTVNQCLGLSNTVDSIINYTLYKDEAYNSFNQSEQVENGDILSDNDYEDLPYDGDVNVAKENECPNCFHEISQDDKQCPNCGYPINNN